MKTFSIVEAATEPFRLAFSRPMTTLIWGLVALAPMLLALPLMGFLLSGDFLAAVEGADDAEALRQLAAFETGANLINALQLLTAPIVTAAVVRAVFRAKGADRWAFLRVGMDEVRVLVVTLVIIFGLVVAILVIGLVLGTAGFVLHEALGRWAASAYVGTGVALALALLLASGRLALLAPACLHYKTLAFVQGWRLGRGRTLALAGVVLGVIVGWTLICVLVVAVVAVVIAVLALTGVLSGIDVEADPAAFERWMEAMAAQPLWPALIGLAVLAPFAWLQGLAHALFAAPFARIVHDLAPTPAPISADTARSPE